MDDFDRPITDASVRSFAGAMLDLIREELEKDDNNADVRGHQQASQPVVELIR